MTQDKPYYD
jgi:hypothetical protein